MKIPSIRLISKAALATVRRFPLVMIISFIGTAAGIYFIHSNFRYGTADFFTWQKIILLSILAGVTLISSSLFAIRNELKKSRLLIIDIIILLIITGYFFLFQNYTAHYYRYFLYVVAAHLLVSYSAYIFIMNESGYWQFNKLLLLRIVNALFFSGVLYLGLALAVVAINKLFDTDWSDNVYGYIASLIFGIFNTWYFLSGIPDDMNEVDATTDYPKILKLFAQYILIPLASVYLIILYAYEIKILIQWSLPIGWVSSLIIAYSAVGILAYLLVHPLRNEEGKTWVRVYSNLFFKLLYPLIILLALAISRRISDYGITESRYMLIIITLWLTVIALYYTFSKRKNLKAIGVSLLITSVVISAGPWGAFAISESSQIKRFFRIIEHNKIIRGGRIYEVKNISARDVSNLRSIVNYIKGNHGMKGLMTALLVKANYKTSIPLDSLTPDLIFDALKIDSAQRNQTVPVETGNAYFNLDDYMKGLIKIDGYEYSGKIRLDNKEPVELQTESMKLNIITDKDAGLVKIENDHNSLVLAFDLLSKYGNLASRDRSTLKPEDFMMVKENESLKVMILIDFIGGYSKKGSAVEVYSSNFDIYIKVK